jgi:hypothetical protein
VAAKLARLPSKAATVTLGAAIEPFLDEADLAPTTRLVYSSSLAALALGIGAGATLGELEPVTLSAWFTGRYRDTAPRLGTASSPLCVRRWRGGRSEAG